jgi:hypothetical protein
VLRTEVYAVERQPHAEMNRHMPRIGTILGIERAVQDRAAQALERKFGFPRRQHQTRESKKCRRRTGNGNPIERHAREQIEEVLLAAERNALRSDRLASQRMIGIKQRLRRRVADHVDPGLAVLEQIADLRVRAFAVAFTGQFALDPGGVSMRVGKASARKRKFARPFAGSVRRQVGRLQRHTGSRLHLHLGRSKQKNRGHAFSLNVQARRSLPRLDR